MYYKDVFFSFKGKNYIKYCLILKRYFYLKKNQMVACNNIFFIISFMSLILIIFDAKGSKKLSHKISPRILIVIQISNNSVYSKA